MTGRARKLRDMDIDEISLVDRAANQHASILFSKAQEDDMPEYDEGIELYDPDGYVVDFDSVEVGDVVYDDAGNEYVMVEDDGSGDEAFYDEEVEYVGKARIPDAHNAAYAASVAGKRVVPHAGTGYKLGGWPDAGTKVSREGKKRMRLRDDVNRWSRRKKIATGSAVGLTAAGAAGGGGYAMSKSLGDVLVDELSKSADQDRQVLLAQAMGDEIEKAQAQAADAIAYAEQLHDERVTEAFISKAAEYNLPVDPSVLGVILKSAAAVLDAEQLDVLDELFTGIGEQLFYEYGALGDTDNNDVFAQVDALAGELVGKSAGDMSRAEATTALFEANPDAYEMYVRENRGF